MVECIEEERADGGCQGDLKGERNETEEWGVRV